MNRNLLASCLLGSLLAWVGSPVALAVPQVSGTASLTPASLGGGDVATFSFSFTNAIDPNGAVMTGTALQVGWSAVMVNGVASRFDLIGMSAPGGSVSFTMGPGGEITGVVVHYPQLPMGTSRSFSASFQVPEHGLENGSTFQSSASLSWLESAVPLTRSATATLRASPLLQVALEPSAPSTVPGGILHYRASYWNPGSGVARRAWMVVPIHPNTHLVRVGAGTGRPRLWFSATSYPLEQVNSDGFIRDHFQPGILNDNGTPSDASDDFWTSLTVEPRMMAMGLDDPDLNLLPSGTAPYEIAWSVEDGGSPVSTVIQQVLAGFADGLAPIFSNPNLITIRLLPADLTIAKTGNSYRVSFAGEQDGLYRIERSVDLNHWSNVGAPFQTNPGNFEFLDSNPPPSTGFYRVASP